MKYSYSAPDWCLSHRHDAIDVPRCVVHTKQRAPRTKNSSLSNYSFTKAYTGLQCVETVGWRENMTCTVRLWLDFTPCSRNGASPHLTSSLSCANLLYILLELQSHWDLIAHQLAVKSEGTHCATNDCIQNRQLSFLMEPTRDAALFTSHLTVKWLQCKHKYSHISHSLLTFKLH